MKKLMKKKGSLERDYQSLQRSIRRNWEGMDEEDRRQAQQALALGEKFAERTVEVVVPPDSEDLEWQIRRGVAQRTGEGSVVLSSLSSAGPRRALDLAERAVQGLPISEYRGRMLLVAQWANGWLLALPNQGPQVHAKWANDLWDERDALRFAPESTEAGDE